MAKKRRTDSINSSREYTVQESTQGSAVTFEATLYELLFPLDEDAECMYALNDMLDDVLDMELNESKYFQPSRDDNHSKGIITRTK